MNPSTFKNPFSSGLGRTGRIGAWVVAFGIVVAWNTYDSKKNTTDAFSNEELETWNSEKKTSSLSQEGDAKK